MKAEITSEINHKVDELQNGLFALSQDIHDHPELGYHEFETVKKIKDYLQTQEVKLQDNFCDIPTAFEATFVQGKPEYHFAVLAEFDALPKIGHGCGHNIIATAAIGTFLACRQAMKKFNIAGKVSLIGSPAEEGGGGKIELLKRGAFKDVDVSLMVHPTSGTTRIAGRCTATYNLEIEYVGQAAHAASQPFKGHNALDAANLFFVAIGLLRQQLTSDVRLSGIINDGGDATNIIPERTKISFSLRCMEENELKDLVQKVKNCVQGAAIATGCDANITEKPGYGARVYNQTLGDICRRSLEDLGEPVLPGFPDDYGSTDFGNVSQIMPTTNPYFSLHKTRTSLHTAEYEKLSGTDISHKAISLSAKAMARTIIECFVDKNLMERVLEEKNTVNDVNIRPR